MSSFSLDAADLEAMSRTIFALNRITDETGVILDTPSPLWIEGELVGYLTMENGEYGFMGSLT